MTSSDIKQQALLNYRILFRDELKHAEDTHVGEPLPVNDHDKTHQYWLVPILVLRKVRGVIMYTSDGDLVYYGRLMPNVQNPDDLPDTNYFEYIPEKWLQEVKVYYPDYHLVEYFFSYDQVPQKWGWLVILKHRQSGQLVQVYIGPTGWYTKKSEPGYEG